MNIDILTLVLGVLASAGFISANYVLDRRWSIGLLIAASSILVVQYGPVMGLWGLAALNFLFILRNITFNMARMEKFFTPLLWGWLILLYGVYVFITLFDGGFNGLTLIPLFAIFFNTFALAQKKLLWLKVFLTLNSLTWVVFDLVAGLWGNLIGDAFGLIAGSIAVVRIVIADRNKHDI